MNKKHVEREKGEIGKNMRGRSELVIRGVVCQVVGRALPAARINHWHCSESKKEEKNKKKGRNILVSAKWVLVGWSVPAAWINHWKLRPGIVVRAKWRKNKQTKTWKEKSEWFC